ncbi:MAG TPA: sialidase family protein [Gaiellaceae bacterium]|nr:sialidase family protein [Gaiellaceae bacterium]
MWSAVAVAAAAVGLLAVASGSAGTVIATPISSDPYTNTSSQHKTQLEPDSFAYENTIVATFQTGRFFDGGSSNIGWATSTNGGRTWTTGMLPGTTIYQNGPWARISDPAVAYDPLHDVWMISGLAIDQNVSGAAILTSRSTDGGLTWQNPVTTVTSPGTFLDKNWIVCDTWASSPYYGNCYTEWDDSRMSMTTSTDGGLTWGPVRMPGGGGVGGQPVVQSNGNVIVPYEGGAGIRSFRSIDGGATWLPSVAVATVSEHGVNGGLRTSPLPSAEVAQDGRVYVAWQDCRFRSGCTANDIVYSTSMDGVTWTAPVRVPIDPTDSGVDHFIPGFAVDRNTSGSTTHLALGYYYYPVSSCNSSTCQLTQGFVSSLDNGATWTAPTRVAGPISLAWIASTNQGRMVGDYESTSFTADGKAHPVFAWAKPPTGSVFTERAATATFDPTAPQVAPRVRAGTERPVFRGPGALKLRGAY